MYLLAYFADRGVPKTGLTPTINVIKISDGTVLVNSAAMVEVGQGSYRYNYTSYDRSIPIYFICDGGISLADPDRYAIGFNEDPLDRVIAGLTTQEKTDVQAECTTATAPIKSKTDNLPIDPADESLLEAEINANEVKIDSIIAKLPTNYIMGSAVQSDKDDEIDAIKAKTDNLPGDPADESNIIGAIAAVDNKITGIQSQTTAIQAVTDDIQFDGSNNIQARINDAGVIAADIATILAQANKLQFDGSNNVLAKINDAGVIDAAYIAAAVWDASIEDYYNFDTMGNEQSKLTIDVAFSPDVDQIPGNVITGVNPALLEVQYRSLTGDPAFILKIAYIYGVFATYILARIRAGVLDILGTGPFTDIADDTTYGVRAVFSIADYLPGDLYYMQISNLAWYIKERFYFMPGFAKFIVITPEEDLSAIKAQTDKLQFDGFNNIQARINDTNQLSLLTRILGLTHENVYTVNTFTGNTHTGSVIELYDTKANADLHDGVTGLIAKYTLTVYLTSGLPTSHKMVKEP